MLPQGHAQQDGGPGAAGNNLQSAAQSLGPCAHAGQPMAVTAPGGVQSPAVVAHAQVQLSVLDTHLDLRFRAAGVAHPPGGQPADRGRIAGNAGRASAAPQGPPQPGLQRRLLSACPYYRFLGTVTVACWLEEPPPLSVAVIVIV